MSERHVARFKLTFRDLEQALGLPEGAKIVGVGNSVRYFNGVDVKVTHPDLLKVQEGSMVPEVAPVFEQDGARGQWKLVDWGMP